MKSSYAALGVMGLALGGLWYAGGGTTPPPAAAAEQVRVSSPISHNNLTVYFVHGTDAVTGAKVATLQEALEAGWAVVHETETVNTLSVENRSADTELFIQEGDIIKGGKQDRMIAIDMLLPPKSGVVPFPAHCVEHGRWTGRGVEDEKKFHASTKFAAGNELRIANATYQQSEVWKQVKENQDKLSAKVGEKVNAAESESSFQLTLENRALQAKVAEYEQALRPAGENRSGVVGVVFVVNGKVTGAEVYGSSALFQKAWPKLLNSAATEALVEKTDRATPPAPTAREVEHFLACGGREETQPARGRDINGAAVEYINVNDLDNHTSVQLETAQRGRVTGNNFNPGFAAPQGGTVVGGARFAGVNDVTRNRARVSGNSGELDRTAAADEVQDLLEVVRPIGNNEMNRDAVRRVPQPALPPGNRLNINRVDHTTGLVTESRDPARQNAVIHKSYIKK